MKFNGNLKGAHCVGFMDCKRGLVPVKYPEKQVPNYYDFYHDPYHPNEWVCVYPPPEYFEKCPVCGKVIWELENIPHSDSTHYVDYEGIHISDESKLIEMINNYPDDDDHWVDIFWNDSQTATVAATKVFSNLLKEENIND